MSVIYYGMLSILSIKSKVKKKYKSWKFRKNASIGDDCVIEDNVWIGERSTILKGVTTGKGSIVGCDSVVAKSMPSLA